MTWLGLRWGPWSPRIHRMLVILKDHGEIGALAFGPIKDRAVGAAAARRPGGPSLTGPEARATLAAKDLTRSLSRSAV